MLWGKKTLYCLFAKDCRMMILRGGEGHTISADTSGDDLNTGPLGSRGSGKAARQELTIRRGKNTHIYM